MRNALLLLAAFLAGALGAFFIGYGLEDLPLLVVIGGSLVVLSVFLGLIVHTEIEVRAEEADPKDYLLADPTRVEPLEPWDDDL